MRNHRTAQLRSDLDTPDPFQKPGASTSGARAGWWMMRACERRPRATTGRSGWRPACWNRSLPPKRGRITSSGSTPARVMLRCYSLRSTARRKTTRVTHDALGQARAVRPRRVRARFSDPLRIPGVFVGERIVVDESTEATDRGAVEIEDAPRVDF